MKMYAEAKIKIATECLGNSNQIQTIKQQLSWLKNTAVINNIHGIFSVEIDFTQLRPGRLSYYIHGHASIVTYTTTN